MNRLDKYSVDILLLLFIAAWINVPGMLYERFALDALLAYHGHNTFPFFIPSIILIILFCSVIAHRKRIKSFSVMYASDAYFLLLLMVLLALEFINVGSIEAKISFRIIFPILSLYGFYYIYKRLELVIPEVVDRPKLISHTALCLSFVLFIHLLGYLGVVPHFQGTANEDTVHAIRGLLTFQRTDTIQLNMSSYYACFLLYCLLFLRGHIRTTTTIIYILYVLTALILMWNQTRGAMIIALLLIIVRLSDLKGLLYVKIGTLITIITLLSILALQYSNVRIFNLMDSSGLERVTLMLEALKQIGEKPFVGGGAYFENNFRPSAHSSMVVHSAILRFMLAYGTIGLGLFLLVWIKMFSFEWSNRFIAGIILITLCGLFETYLYWWFSLVPLFIYGNSYADTHKERLTG